MCRTTCTLVTDETGSRHFKTFSEYTLVLSFHLPPRFPYGLFPSRFPIKPSTQVSSPPCLPQVASLLLSCIPSP